ncbi:MAG TPA: PPK2 family polyphosphate kinase [Ktedonobacterales bacterium]
MSKKDTGQQYAYRVEPGTRVRLSDYDPRDAHGLKKQEGKALLDQLDDELGALQELLYAADQHSVLLILQGMDTSGKDGTIKHVLKKVNPAGCRIVPFKQPTPQELAHDFLWRVHANTPARGQFGVFNRSHYEDVVIVRVHELVPEATWRSRYAQINAFEQLLDAANTIIIKCFLHISKDEQKERLLAREQDVTKAWKLSAGDWVERRAWDNYTAAYEDALSECSTAAAPWYIVPADRKWYRNLAIAHLLVNALRPHKEEWLAHLDALGKTERELVLKAREEHSQHDDKHH